MKDPRIFQQRLVNLILPQHHIRTGIPVKGKVPVAAGIGMYQRERRVHLRIHVQIVGIDANLRDRRPQLLPKEILSDLSDKSSPVPQLRKHCQHVAGRTARVCLKQGISLPAYPVLRKIDQQFSQSHHIKSFHFTFPPHYPVLHPPLCPRPLPRSWQSPSAAPAVPGNTQPAA